MNSKQKKDYVILATIICLICSIYTQEAPQRKGKIIEDNQYFTCYKVYDDYSVYHLKSEDNTALAAAQDHNGEVCKMYKTWQVGLYFKPSQLKKIAN